MMMRPGSPTTFSNFDHLDHTLPKAAGFPAEAVVRTDRKGVRFPSEIIAGHLDVFADGRAKELLITPNGVRIVWLLAEADRARYGVFRQAEFGDAATRSGARSRDCCASASALREAINRSRTAGRMTSPARLPRTGESVSRSWRGDRPAGKRPCPAARAGARPAIPVLHGGAGLGHRQDRAARCELHRPPCRRLPDLCAVGSGCLQDRPDSPRAMGAQRAPR